MKHKHFILICIFLPAFIFNISFAGNIEIKAAKNVALNAYKENYATIFSKDAGSIFISEEFTVSENSQAIYYVFNMSNKGFIIVAADDIVHPVLGYSFESFYTMENQSPEFKYWMNIYERQITNAVSLKLSATPEIEQEWNRYNVKPENFAPVKGTKDVTPLLTSTWDQGCCYNALCPVDAAATNSCGRCYVGCVATAMAQVMYYYRYPAQGQSSHSYYAFGYGTLSANFGATTYDWNAMTDACIGTNAAIATLSYHCGVAVDMGYGPDGSGANTSDWVYSLPAYFKYSSSIDYAQKDFYSSTTWENMLKTELDAKRPVVYTGWDTDGGHAWNCDGYQGTYFHMNWGWGGNSNGNFLLSALTAGGYDFTSGQSMVYNIYPGTGYPSYCTGTGTLTAINGTFTDGSGTSDYQDNADCSWLISPSDVIDHLKINFNYLSTETTNDVVTIYDGPNTSSPVLGTYSGSTVPAQITSTSPEVLVRFTANGSTTDAGWMIFYNSVYPVYCTGTVTLTDAGGSFDDGSGVNNYNNNSNCKWDIIPPGAETVTLHFNSFSLESDNDKVRIFDLATSTLLANYSGSSIPADVTSPSGQMKVIFLSNSSVTDDGFSASYTSTPVGVEEYGTLKDLNIYPNPANNMLHISFGITDGNNASVQLFDLKGQLVFNESIQSGTLFNKNVDITTFAKGVYNLRIITSGETVNKKVVIQ
ncbi:MAG: C10 family peptidase [Bacteroidota bacterium]